MKYPSLSSVRQSLPNSVLILAPHMWGASPKDRWMWMAEKNGQVLDYDAKWCLIRDYLKAGDEVFVLTCHKDGTVTAKKQFGEQPLPSSSFVSLIPTGRLAYPSRLDGFESLSIPSLALNHPLWSGVISGFDISNNDADETVYLDEEL